MATLGNDGQGYLERIRSWGASTEYVRVIEESYTAQAMIITDRDNNQITAFHPGAMQHAHVTPVPRRKDIELAIVAPDGRDAMIQHAQQLADAGIPFIFDPGQGLPMFNGEELKDFIAKATWVALNDYEARMLCERTGLTLESLSKSHLKGVIVTLGAEGCEIWERGARTHVPGVPAESVVDPTGCGDAFRAGVLFGVARRESLREACVLGNWLGALKAATAGAQNHQVAGRH